MPSKHVLKKTGHNFNVHLSRGFKRGFLTASIGYPPLGFHVWLSICRIVGLFLDFPRLTEYGSHFPTHKLQCGMRWRVSGRKRERYRLHLLGSWQAHKILWFRSTRVRKLLRVESVSASCHTAISFCCVVHVSVSLFVGAALHFHLHIYYVYRLVNTTWAKIMRVENPNKCMLFSEKLSVVICFAIYLNNFCLHFLVTFFQHLFSCYFESTLSICKSAYYNLILFSCNYFPAACVCEYIMSCGSCWRAKCSGHIRKVGGCCVISRKVRAT